jgi:hypothetical protein
MHINTIRLTPDRPGYASISWPTTDGDWPAWVYLDGDTRIGPLFGDASDTERSVIVPWPTTETHVVEVQELPSIDIMPAPLTIAPTTRPTISWTAHPTAERYRIYHRATPTGTDTELYDGQVVADELGICRLTCPIELDGRGGLYHFLRVEAVDNYGNESTRLSWVYWAAEPDDQATLAVAAGSGAGLYDITLTE